MKEIFLLIVMSFSLVAESTRCWKSLPASTLAAIEIDLSDDLLAKLRQNTALGQTILTEKKLGNIIDVVKKHSLVNPKLASVLAELRSSGFTIDEMLKILNSKLGIALIPEEIDGQLYWSLVAWADMKKNLASKIIFGLKEREHGKASKVNDLETLSYENDWDSSFSLLSVANGQLIMISSDLDAKYKNGQKVEDTKSRDICLKRFHSFTSALHNQGHKGFYANIKKGSFFKGNNFPGRRVIEYHLDMSKFFQLTVKNKNKIKFAGLDQLKMLSGLVSLDEKKLQSKLFIETDIERKSLVKLMDQPQIPTQAESWVPSNISSYTHMSVDVKLIFDQIREMSSMQFGKAAVNNHLKALNTRSRAFLGADLKSILSSFGNKITFVDYGVELNNHNGNIEPQINSALVTTFSNESVSNRILEILTPFAEEKGVLRKDQFGFKGFQINSNKFSGSLYFGRGNLIFTIGKETIDKVLKSIISPPKNNLRNSKEFQDFRVQIGHKTSSMVTYGNLKNGIGNFYDLVQKVLREKNAFAGMEKRDKAFVYEILSTFPTKAEVLSVLGIAGAYAKPVHNGLEVNGFMELP